jgi:uncharacterized membrane protein
MGAFDRVSKKTDRNPKKKTGGDMNVRAVVAEFVGTFALVLIGAGAVVLSDGDIVTIAFAHGLVLTMGVTLFLLFIAVLRINSDNERRQYYE